MADWRSYMETLLSEGWSATHPLQPGPCRKCGSPTLSTVDYVGRADCERCDTRGIRDMKVAHAPGRPHPMDRHAQTWEESTASERPTAWPLPIGYYPGDITSPCGSANLALRKALACDWTAVLTRAVGPYKGAAGFETATSVALRATRGPARRVGCWIQREGKASWQFSVGFAWGDMYLTRLNGNQIKGEALL